MSVKNYEELLERQLSEAKAEIARLRKSLEDRPDAIDLKGQIVQLKAELAKHQGSEFHPDWSMLQATQKSLREVGAENERLKSECAYLGKSVSQLVEARLSLEDSVDRLQKKNADLQRQRDGVQNAKAYLEQVVRDRDWEIEKLKAETEQLKSEVKRANQNERAEVAELKSTRQQSAAEVLAAVRCEAAPHGWSDITAGGHRVVAAFFDDSWGRIAAVIDLGDDRVGGRYVENAWNADSGKGYRGAGCNLVPATELEAWGISDPLPPPVPDPDCQPDAIDEPPDLEAIEIRPGDRIFVVPSEIVQHGDHDVITCDYLRIVRPRQ